MSSHMWRTAALAAGTSVSLILGTVQPVAFAQVASAADVQQTTNIRLRVDGNAIAAEWDAVEGTDHYTAELISVASGAVVGESSHTIHTRTFFTAAASGRYYVQVTAWQSATQHSEPVRSQEIEITGEITVPAAPDAPVFELLGGGTARVQWQRNSNGGSGITGSEITLRPQGGGADITKLVEGETNSAEISGLVQGKTYTAVVRNRNIEGYSPESQPSDPIVVTADPTGPQLTVTPTKVDATKATEFKVDGVGYTGGAVAEGVFIVVWDARKWTPGQRPSTQDFAFSRSFVVQPSEITDGHFSKKITIEANSFDQSANASYLIGTIAGGTAIGTDRRVDKAVPLELQAQPVTNVKAAIAETDNVVVTWDPPTAQTKVAEYRVKLFKVQPNGEQSFVTQLSRGPQFREATFVDQRPGQYVATVEANISEDFWVQNFSTPVRSNVVEIKAPEVTKPHAPTSVTLRATQIPGQAEVLWIDPGDTGGGRILGYRVTLIGGAEPAVKEIGGNETSAQFSGLKAGVTYTATVELRNSFGYSDPSAPSGPLVLTEGAATEDENVEITLADTRIDVTTNSSIEVTGRGYTGISEVDLFIVEAETAAPRFAATKVQVVDGNFRHALRIPARTLDPRKKYTVMTSSSGKYEARALLKFKDPATAQPRLTVDSNKVDSAKKTVIKVSGTGYVGDGAAQGVYVVVYDTATWKPGQKPSARNALAEWVRSDAIVDGRFSVNLQIPAGSLDPKKKWAIGTFAAHALSQTDRSLDSSLPLEVAGTPTPPTTTTTATTTPTTSATTSTTPSSTTSTTSAPAPKPDPKEPSDAGSASKDKKTWVIVGSVLGVLAAIAAALGAVMTMFPQFLNGLRLR
ncbi:MAG: fibronectin type III domain-containing protein [Corynebacterium sp.]|uniref:fibronectin type III domain-containing protein n=1 Tax=Corynebacterium sp. TaxID=1720 RepID=UPI0026DB49B4|nr:fibronectin type III domain-containing protein [Corynebacterium sp.]MDO5099053.1 fibronectin type III domain-containing protein [Corynebacterium sp.]